VIALSSARNRGADELSTMTTLERLIGVVAGWMGLVFDLMAGSSASTTARNVFRVEIVCFVIPWASWHA
jgi:hypothetical protein